MATTTFDEPPSVSVGYANVVEQLYVAYFGRPADPSGFSNFKSALFSVNAPTDIADLTSAYSTNSSVKDYVDAFGLSAESGRLYPSTDTSVFVKAIFNNVLNRDPLSGGLNFWVDAIDNKGLTKGNAALAIMNGALQNTTTQGLLDAAAVNNKITVALDFTASCDTSDEIRSYSGQTAAGTVRSMLKLVSDVTDTSVFHATVADTLTSLVAAAPAAMTLPADSLSGEELVPLIGMHTADYY